MNQGTPQDPVLTQRGPWQRAVDPLTTYTRKQRNLFPHYIHPRHLPPSPVAQGSKKVGATPNSCQQFHTAPTMSWPWLGWGRESCQGKRGHLAKIYETTKAVFRPTMERKSSEESSGSRKGRHRRCLLWWHIRHGQAQARPRGGITIHVWCCEMMGSGVFKQEGALKRRELAELVLLPLWGWFSSRVT